MSAQSKVNNLFERIKTARTDPAIGIRIEQLTGDDTMSQYVAARELHRSVPAHYSQAGSGIYPIVHGGGKLHTRVPSPHDAVTWSSPVDVRSGDCFTVQGEQVHQMENTGSLAKIAIIVSPPAHIGHDRFIVPGAVLHQPGGSFYAALSF